MSHAQSAGARQAALHLRELLLRPGRYRHKWEQYIERSRPGEINQLAVAEVLARHLWEHPRRPGDAEVLPRQIKDTVFRVVTGRLLSRSTLGLFVDAFDLPEQEEERLRKLWEGSGRIRVLTGPRALPPETAAALGPRLHQTISVHEHHYLGVDGLPARHRTIQVIEATADGVDRYPYRADTNALTVEIAQGCKGLVGPLYEVQDGVFAVDIGLTQPLALGETATLEYWTSFQYAIAPKREFRRAAQGRMENVDIRVEFHPAKLPGAVWWAIWDGLDGEIIEEEEVLLDDECAVHRYLRSMENTVVGFHWDWPELVEPTSQ